VSFFAQYRRRHVEHDLSRALHKRGLVLTGPDEARIAHERRDEAFVLAARRAKFRLRV